MDCHIQHFHSDDQEARQQELPAGYKVQKHKHSYSHISILAEGKCIVRSGDEEKTYAAPACIVMPAGVPHEIEALEDITWYCIHAKVRGAFAMEGD